MPQQHAARHCRVQTLDAVCHRDADGHVAGLDGPVRQALPLAADDDAQPAREIVPGLVQRTGAVERRRQRRHAAGTQRGQRGGQIVAVQRRQPPRRTHRGPQRLGRQRRRAARPQHNGIKAERGSAAQQRTHVAGVLHALQHQNAAGRVQRVRGRHGRFKQGKHALIGFGAA